MHIVTILVFLVSIPLVLLGLVYIYEALRPVLGKAIPQVQFPKLVPHQYLQKMFSSNLPR